MKYSQHIYRATFILLFLLVLCEGTTAQKKNFQLGYIVHLNNDTIYGHVRDREEGIFEALYDKIHFVPAGKRWKKKYSPQDIKGYGYEGANFEAVPLQEEVELFINRYYLRSTAPKVFLKLIQRNEMLTHYQKEFMDEDNATVESFPLFHKNGSSQMVRVTQGLWGLKKKRLMEYFYNCPALVSAIGQKEVSLSQEVYDFYTEECNHIN